MKLSNDLKIEQMNTFCFLRKEFTFLLVFLLKRYGLMSSEQAHYFRRLNKNASFAYTK